jgi:hypothetical protein
VGDPCARLSILANPSNNIIRLDKAGPRSVCPTRHWREGRRRERGRRRNRLFPPSPSRLLSPSPRPHTPPPTPRRRREGDVAGLVFGDGVERFHQDQERYRFRGVRCRSVERAGPGTLSKPPLIRFLELLGAVLVGSAQFCGICCRFGQICRVKFGGLLIVCSFRLIVLGLPGISPEMRVCRNLSEER